MNQLTSEFKKEIVKFSGKQCWGFVAGKGTGSIIALDFGDLIKRRKPLNNSYLTKEQREYKAEMSFMISCAWRVNDEGKVICSSTDSNEPDGPMITGLKNIVGKRVTLVTVKYPAFDVELTFESDYKLTVFCDQTNQLDETDNYTFFSNGKSYTVESRSRLKLEKETKSPGCCES